MKGILFSLLCILSSFSMGQKNTKDLMLGKWVLQDSLDKGDLEFKGKGMFTMRFFLNEPGIDTLVITGKYTCNSKILFLKIGTEPAFEYRIDFIDQKNLIIQYKETRSSYMRKEEEKN